jgi:hypothetical protein
MGASAGTGVRSFAEGGSTSAPTSTSKGEASAAPPRQIYQPQYTDYGLGSTPQAQGRLASILNMGNYGNQMPTFTRPQATPQMSYRTPIPMSTGTKAVTDPNLAAINQAFVPRQTQYDPDGNPYNAPVYMDPTQRNTILENPGTYLEYAQYVQGGGDPAQFSRQAQPIQYMTQAQREALMEKQRLELSRLLPQALDSGNDSGF